MLDPIQNHASSIRLCFVGFRTSPAASLRVVANEPSLELRRHKLCLQYCTKLILLQPCLQLRVQHNNNCTNTRSVLYQVLKQRQKPYIALQESFSSVIRQIPPEMLNEAKCLRPRPRPKP